MQISLGLSRQLLDPAEQISEPVPLYRNDDCIIEHQQSANLVLQGNCTNAIGIQAIRVNSGAFLKSRSPIYEAWASADTSKRSLTNSNRRLFPAFKSFTNVSERSERRFVYAIVDNGEDSLIFLLANKLGSVANRLALIIDSPQNAQTRNITHTADTVNVLKPNALNTTGATRRVKDARQVQMTDTDIKIHISAPTVLVNQQRLSKSLLNLSTQRHGHRVCAKPVLRSLQMGMRSVSYRSVRLKYGTRCEIFATKVYEKLVERIYDG